VDDGWEVCWSCGTSIDGEEDPSFGAEDEDAGWEDQPAEPAGVDQEPVRLVTVATFPVTWQAHVARARLEAEGIPCLLGDELVADLFVIERFAWVKLQVAAEDAEAAHALLESWRAGGEEGGGPPSPETGDRP
jgi:hypothetical protein